jgi:hypothetical protein
MNTQGWLLRLWSWFATQLKRLTGLVPKLKLPSLHSLSLSEKSQRIVFLSVAALLLCLALGGCAHRPSAPMNLGTATAAQYSGVQCAPWRSIHYSSKDNPRTIKEVRVHDQTGVNLGCWKTGD